ncbi:flagellar M-ring protein FliF [Candidatus Dependentiae bacterium]|nr:flagellar M-ring protein FliF [Candidatus Dependentiae bacterium]
MKDFFNKFKEQGLNVWNNLSKKQKITIISIVALALTAIIITAIITSGEKLTPLFDHKLSIEDAGQVKKSLDDWRENYKYDANLGYLYVSSERKNDILLKLGSENKLPKSNITGFEIFKDLPRGLTEYEKKIHFKIATEGALTRMIQGLGPIKSAVVAISLPDRPLFSSMEESSKASITIELKPYEKLEKKQIKGIINLASYYIPNCKSENIMLVDSATGESLNDEIEDKEIESETKVDMQNKIKEREEKKLKNKIINALGKILSHRRITAEVTIEYNFDKEEAKSTEFSNPGFDPIKRSEETLDEKFEGIGFKEGGKPGVTDNIPVYKSAENGPIKYEKKENRINYEPNKLEKSIVRNPTIKRVSASLMVDGIWEYTEPSKPTEKIKRTYKHLTPELLKSLEEGVKSAIGYNPDRNDSVKVVELQFDRTAEFEYEDKLIKSKLQKERMFKITVLSIVCLVIIFIFLFEMHKRWKLRKEELLRKRELATQDQALGSRLIADSELTPEEREKLELLKHAQDMAQKKPEMVAALLRTWLFENR